MDPDDRIAKKVREAERLRDLTPQRTLHLGSGLMEFSRKVGRAAERAPR